MTPAFARCGRPQAASGASWATEPRTPPAPSPSPASATGCRKGRSRDGRSLQACEPPLWLPLDKVSDAMTHPDMAVVTGAFSYTGNYVARRLLKQGVRVRTLTRRPDQPNPFGGAVEAAPLDFSDSDGLRRSMEGRMSSTTPTGYGSHGAGSPSTAPSRTRRPCSWPLRGPA